MRGQIFNGWRFITAGLICLVSVFAVPACAESIPESSSKVFTVGVVPQYDVRRIHAVWRPILDEMEKRTGFTFVLRGAATIPAFERDLAVGEFDIAYVNPYQVVRVGERQGYQPLLRDATDLYGILVVPSNSSIQSVLELKDQAVAFPAPNALGATLLMRAELFDRFGIEVVPKYVQSHSSVYLNVALQETIAGGGVQKTLNQQSEELQGALRVLYKTETVPSHPLVVHPHVPVSIQSQLSKVMLELGQEPHGRELFSLVPITELRPAFTKEYLRLGEMGLERFQ